MRHAIALFAFAALPAAAQDTTFQGSDLFNILSGQTIEFFDASMASYGADGTYEYRYRPEDPVWRGIWDAEGAEVCVTFENGFARCDTFIRSGDRLVMVIADGTRFPVKSVNPIAQ